MAKKIQGSFVGHSACPKSDCGSSDALAVYKKIDEDGVEFSDGYCWSCDRFVSPKELGEDYVIVSHDDEDGGDLDLQDLKDIEELRCVGWKNRKLKTPVNSLYGVRSSFDSETGDVDARFYPITKDDNIVGFKKRGLPKDFVGLGNTKATNQLFGQSVFNKGGKYLVITTGEEDALAVAQTLHTVKGEQEFWTPVVSVTAGDGSILKQMKANFEYINSFEKVVLMFDQDDAGQKYVEEAAKLLNPGKAYIAKLPLKDASDMVKNRRSGELKQAFWKADRFSPVDVCTLGQLWEEFENAGDEEIIDLPFEFTELRRAMGGGPAMGEVTVIGALTSVGKSTILNNIVYDIAFKSPRKVGLLYLESSPKEIVQSFLSIHTEKNLALQDRKSMDMQALKYDFFNMVGDDSNIVTVNHNGSFTSVDEMFEKIRWLIKAAGCDCVFLDPLQAAVPSNENSVIDEFMDNLLKLAKETGASIFVVSHMKKPSEDDPHGVSEYNLKGPLDGETEYLTRSGWKKIKDWSGDEIATWKEGVMQYEKPLDYIKKPSTEMIHVYNSNSIDMIMSPDHRVPFYNSKDEFEVLPASEFVEKSCAKIPTAFHIGSQGINLTDEEIRAMVMVAADGCKIKSRPGNIQIAVKRDRKKVRVKELLDAIGVYYWEYEDHNGCTVFRFKELSLHKELHLCAEWYSANSHQLSVLLDEVFYWDGHDSKNGKGRYFSTTKEGEADIVQFAAHACGLRSGKNYYSYPDNDNCVDSYQVYVSREGSRKSKSYFRKKLTNVKETTSSDGFQYCFSTEAGFFIARSNGRIFVTGNSSSINQIAFNTLLLSRDKTNSDPVIKNTTKMTLVKCRRTGETGDAGWLRYTHHNGRLSAANNPYDDAEEREETMDDFLNGGGFDEEAGDSEYEEAGESVVRAPKDEKSGKVAQDGESNTLEEPEFDAPPWDDQAPNDTTWDNY